MTRGMIRPFEACRRDLARFAERRGLFGHAERELRRGEIRFAAEVMLASLCGENPPERIVDRAIETLGVMAKG